MLRECENVYFSKCDCHAFVFLLLFIHCPFRYTSFRAWIFINAYLFHVGSLYLWSFIYVIIVPLSIWVAVKTSTIFMSLSAVCAIIERINPSWVCVVLFDRSYEEKVPAFNFLWFILAWSASVPLQDKGLCSCMFICINSNDMGSFLASYSSHLRGLLQPFGGIIVIADAPNPQKHGRERGLLQRGRGRLLNSFIVLSYLSPKDFHRHCHYGLWWAKTLKLYRKWKIKHNMRF